MFFKALVILILAAAVFGSAAYYTYELFIRPQKELEAEIRKGPPPPPPDPSLPDFAKIQSIDQEGDKLAARKAYEGFIERHPRSSKLDEAKTRLGEINTELFFSTEQTPTKQLYIVRPGDALNKVARRTKTSPELLMRTNDLKTINLQIGQKLYYTPATFSLEISLAEERLTLLNDGKFFKQYRIRSIPKSKKPDGKRPKTPQEGKVTDQLAWGPSGGRLIFTDPEYHQANFWISLSLAGFTLYSEPENVAPETINKPPGGGLGIAPADAAELAVLLNKGDSVVIQ